MGRDSDCFYNSEIVCPYCYLECEDDSYYVVRNSEGDYVNFQCEHCGKDFKVLAQTTITYDSARFEDGKIIEEWNDDDEVEE